jgi:hypothetical protein
VRAATMTVQGMGLLCAICEKENLTVSVRCGQRFPVRALQRQPAAAGRARKNELTNTIPLSVTTQRCFVNGRNGRETKHKITCSERGEIIR